MLDANRPTSLWQKKWFLCLALAVFILLIYWPVTKFQFVDWDDWQLLAENPDFLPVNWGKIAGYWIHGRYELYAPLSYSLWAAIAWCEQQFRHRTPLLAGPFHVANLLLHLGAVEMVFLLLCRLFRRALPAFAGAMVFAFHPLQIEAVAWVSSVNTLLSCSLSITALWLYVCYAQSEGKKVRVLWFIASCVILLLALCAKAMAAPTVALALVLEITVLRRKVREYGVPILIWIVLTIPFLLLTRHMQPAVVPSQTPLWMRPLVAGDSFSFYLAKLFFPVHLAIDYQRTPFWLWNSGRIWFTWLLVPVVIFPVIRLFHRPRLVLIGLVMMLIAVLPTSGIIGFAFQRYSTVADRYMYLGMLGIAFAVAGIAANTSAKLFCGIAVPVLCLLVARDIPRIHAWHDTLALTAAAESPGDACATDHRIRAFALSRLGFDGKSIAQYKLAIHYDRTDADTYYDYANLLCRIGNVAAAIEPYERAISLQSGRGEFHHNYAVALMSLGQTAAAGSEFRIAAELSPESTEARNDYAKWLRMQSR